MDEVKWAWPKLDDELISAKEDFWSTAYVTGWRRDSYEYAYSYRRAAEVLFENIRGRAAEADSLVYPFVFLWRQHLELMMKTLIAAAGHLLDRHIPAPLHHRLVELWQTLKPLLQEIEPNNDRDLLAAEKTIEKFDSIDPRSMAFRYPRDTHGKPSLPPDLERINLANLQRVCIGVGNLFSGCYDAIDFYEQNKPSPDDY